MGGADGEGLGDAASAVGLGDGDGEGEGCSLGEASALGEAWAEVDCAGLGEETRAARVEDPHPVMERIATKSSARFKPVGA